MIKKILLPCSSARDVPVKFYITYIIINCFLSQLGYLLSILIVILIKFPPTTRVSANISYPCYYIFRAMNGKFPSKNSRAEGENDEMGIPNYRKRLRLNQWSGLCLGISMLALAIF